MVQAIEQGECTECGAMDENYQIEAREMGDSKVAYRAICECGASASVTIDGAGLCAESQISHESASWNTTNESES
jgi:hypothetical protein